MRSVLHEEANAVNRVHRSQDFRRRDNAFDPKHSQGSEPHERHASKNIANFPRAKTLHREQRDQDDNGDGNDVRLEKVCGYIQAFHRTQH